MNEKLFLLAINLTRRCNLACAHCYLDANTLQHGGPNELSSDEVGALLEAIARRSPETMVVLTGGEPLLRRDLDALAARGTKLGLAMVAGSNGVLLTEQRVQSLKRAGTLGVGISLDSLDPAVHDAFRGAPGSWQKTMTGIENCRRYDLTFQIHFSVTENNADELPAMIDFARSSGARVMNVFFLICTGRGESMSDITPERYEQALHDLVEAQGRNEGLIIRPRCAPHYKRVAHQQNPHAPITRISGYEGDGCIAGVHYCRITPEGGITACPYISKEAGNIRTDSFWYVWDNSDDFRALRKPSLKGECGDCEYRKLCGGCRARPLARGGGLMDTDPLCAYQPQGGAVIPPLQDLSAKIRWSAEAEQRLKRVPAFLRKMVKKRAEAYVAELSEEEVTPAHLAVLSARRFGHAGPPRK
ncbi:MAG: radical SAM protein [Gammaproteobacteria bacterium]|nr:radical SAM protein [Gammaproteobacteria bacterium]